LRQACQYICLLQEKEELVLEAGLALWYGAGRVRAETYEGADGQACGDAGNGAGADEAYCAADAGQQAEDVGWSFAGGIRDGSLWVVR
jgi:hypothetical protein